MIETPSAAFRQSSRERRSPVTNSVSVAAGDRPSIFLKAFKLLEGRTKQRRLEEPYPRSVSTTLTPMKPFAPVTRIGSFGRAMDAELSPLCEIKAGLQSPRVFLECSR